MTTRPIARLVARAALSCVLLAALGALGAPAAGATVLDGARASGDPTYRGGGVVSAVLRPGCIGGVNPCGNVAWRWSGSSWTRTYLCERERVYIFPFTTGWSWAYSYRMRTWVAVEARDLWLDPAGQGWGIPMRCA